MAITYLIVHNTGGIESNPRADTSNITFNQVNNYHRQLWNFKSDLGHYIGYQYFIEKDGTVLQGRYDTEEGAHTRGYNSNSIGICLAGNFDVTMPTVPQITSLRALLTRLATKYQIPLTSIIPHRNKASYKSCFGSKLEDNWARNLLSLPHNQPDYHAIQMNINRIRAAIYGIMLSIRLKNLGGVEDREEPTLPDNLI